MVFGVLNLGGLHRVNREILLGVAVSVLLVPVGDAIQKRLPLPHQLLMGQLGVGVETHAAKDRRPRHPNSETSIW